MEVEVGAKKKSEVSRTRLNLKTKNNFNGKKNKAPAPNALIQARVGDSANVSKPSLSIINSYADIIESIKKSLSNSKSNQIYEKNSYLRACVHNTSLSFNHRRFKYEKEEGKDQLAARQGQVQGQGHQDKIIKKISVREILNNSAHLVLSHEEKKRLIIDYFAKKKALIKTLKAQTFKKFIYSNFVKGILNTRAYASKSKKIQLFFKSKYSGRAMEVLYPSLAFGRGASQISYINKKKKSYLAKGLKLLKKKNYFLEIPGNRFIKFVDSIERTQKFNNSLLTFGACADRGLNSLKFSGFKKSLYYKTLATSDLNLNVLSENPREARGPEHELNMSLLFKFIKIRNFNLFSKLYKKDIFGLPLTKKEFYILRFLKLIKAHCPRGLNLNSYNLGFGSRLQNQNKQQLQDKNLVVRTRSGVLQGKGGKRRGKTADDKVKEIKNSLNVPLAPAAAGAGAGGVVAILTSEYKSYLHNTNKSLFHKEYFF